MSSLDGALVEKMSPKGIELMVGAKRDPGWGTVLLVGLGGIWVEALGDVQLLPGDADESRSSKRCATCGRRSCSTDSAARRRRMLKQSPGRAHHRRLMQTMPEIDRDRYQPAYGARAGKGALRSMR